MKASGLGNDRAASNKAVKARVFDAAAESLLLIRSSKLCKASADADDAAKQLTNKLTKRLTNQMVDAAMSSADGDRAELGRA